MKLRFSVGNTDATFSRSSFTGKATLEIGGKDIELQNPLNPSTHFGFQLTRTWHVAILDYRIVIEKERPQFFAGFRPQTYRIRVDGQLVAQETGF